jgi:hypothetical protein
MCCFLTSLVFFGPRLAFLVYWLIPAGRVKVALAFNGWLVPLLGLIFLPWTTLLYVIVFPVAGVFDWLFLALALVADIAAYTGGFRSRRQVPGYPGA